MFRRTVTAVPACGFLTSPQATLSPIKSSMYAPGRNGSVPLLSGAVGVPPHPEMRAQHATSSILPSTLCPPDGHETPQWQRPALRAFLARKNTAMRGHVS